MARTKIRLIYVCITCRRAGEPDVEPRPGALLAEATEHAAAGTEVEVRRLRCLANCTRGPSAAMRCNGSWTYVFGGLDAPMPTRWSTARGSLPVRLTASCRGAADRTSSSAA